MEEIEVLWGRKQGKEKLMHDIMKMKRVNRNQRDCFYGNTILSLSLGLQGTTPNFGVTPDSKPL